MTPNLGKFYINGSWVEPNGTEEFPVNNPATEGQIGTLRMGNAADVEAAVSAAVKAFETYGLTSKEERLALLRRLREETEKRYDDLVLAITQEMGAPIRLSRTSQAETAIGHLDGFIEALEAQEATGKLPNGDDFAREPIGVCGLITPWNWPMNQIALKVIPALATGCTCVLKPSEYTPISATVYAEIIDAAGYPAGVFNMVHGDGPNVGAALSRHPDIHMMSFTGSTRAGTAVSRDSADTVKRVTLELGGKSPNLVFADADLEKRVKASVRSCFNNTGQSCNAPTRMLVERSCYEEAKAIAKATAEQQAVGDPMEEGRHIGPLFDKIQFDRVQELIQIGIDEGATLLIGGTGKPEGLDKGWFVKPTIFADVNNQMTIARREIFGPVLVMIPFDTEEEAIEIANDTPYGLAAYLQTGDPDRARRVSARLRAGMVHINGGGHSYGSPFGGYKQSGNGREGGMHGLEDFQEFKTLHFA